MLTVGDTLPYENYARILHLIQETHECLKLGLSTNTIAYDGQPPQSHRYFQRSIEGIKLQSPPNNRQRNIVQQNQPQKQDNRRKRQQHPRQRDRTRRNSGEDGPQLLVNDSGWIYCRQAEIRRLNLTRDISVRLCRRCAAVGHECTNDTNCDIGAHAAFASLSQSD